MQIKLFAGRQDEVENQVNEWLENNKEVTNINITSKAFEVTVYDSVPPACKAIWWTVTITYSDTTKNEDEFE